MIEISHSWQMAAAVSGIACPKLSKGETRLTDLHAFDLYQVAEISLEGYLIELADFLGCNVEDALKVHNGIIAAEYPGIAELVAQVRGLKCRTGCLSNTNEPHWETLLIAERYPTIHILDMKMASHLVGVNKPAHAIFERFCSEFGLEPGDIAFFDDAPENVEAAKDCGWNASRIDPSDDPPRQMREYLYGLGVT